MGRGWICRISVCTGLGIPNFPGPASQESGIPQTSLRGTTTVPGASAPQNLMDGASKWGSIPSSWMTQEHLIHPCQHSRFLHLQLLMECEPLKQALGHILHFSKKQDGRNVGMRYSLALHSHLPSKQHLLPRKTQIPWHVHVGNGYPSPRSQEPGKSSGIIWHWHSTAVLPWFYPTPLDHSPSFQPHGKSPYRGSKCQREFGKQNVGRKTWKGL